MSLRDIFRSRQIILLYHRVADVPRDPWELCVSPQHFREHLEILRKYDPIPLADVKARFRIRGGNACSVAITFDDGYVDNFLEAAPLLDQFRIPATFFIITGRIGKNCEFWWDELERLIFEAASLPPAIPLSASSGTDAPIFHSNAGPVSLYFALYEFFQPMDAVDQDRAMAQLRSALGEAGGSRPAYRPMTGEEVAALARNGLFEIGAHTVTHPKLSALPAPVQESEIVRSKVWLEDLLGTRVASFSYPYGGRHHYSPDSVRAVREAGFARACTAEAHLVSKTDAIYELPRFRVTNMDGRAFEAFLNCLTA